MIRVELIANHSVEENIMDALKEEGVGKFYTKYPNILGVGSSGPRMGDAIWPEENFALVIWCDEAEAAGIARAAAVVKEKFPQEGIKVFGVPGEVPPRPALPAVTQAALPLDREAIQPPAMRPPEPALEGTGYPPEAAAPAMEAKSAPEQGPIKPKGPAEEESRPEQRPRLAPRPVPTSPPVRRPVRL